jgi:drug/metabolite transporter (DMT)-like permease
VPGTRKSWVSLTVIVLLGMFGFTLAMMYGMRLVSGVVGSIIMSTTPAVTGAAAIIFMRERPDWRILTAIGLGVAGVVVMNLGVDNVGRNLWLGGLLVFVAVCCEAAYTLIGKRAMRNLSATSVAAIVAAASVPGFLIGIPVEWSEFHPARIAWQDWFAVAWWGAGTMGLGSVLWYAGVKRTKGATAAAYMGVMPISALVLSYVLLGEEFRWLHLLGFGIVLVGVGLVAWSHAAHSEHKD